MRLHRLLLGFLGVVAPAEARGALGGDAASVTADCAALEATHEVTRAGSWEKHVLHLSSGTVVHEYLRDGKVFAVAWAGTVLPDFRRLLGAYFEPYVKSPQGTGTGQHHMRVVATRDFVVQSGGHHRAFLGRAWLPAELPTGFDLQTVRAW
jgi:hypothetical protein